MYDVLVIGGGTAGVEAAKEARKNKASVCIIEAHLLGGQAVWGAMIPLGHMLSQIKRGQSRRWQDLKYGIKEKQIRLCEDYRPETLRALGIDLVLDKGILLDEHTVKTSQGKIRGQKIILATGLNTESLYEGALNPHEFFDLEDLPTRVIVLAGHRYTSQMTELLLALGVETTVICPKDFMAYEEDLVKNYVTDALLERGLILYEDANLMRIEQRDQGVNIVFTEEDVEISLQTEVVIDMTVRALTLDDNPIKVNTYLKTASHAIYAAGDCASKYHSVAVAKYEGQLACENALSKVKRRRIGFPIWKTSSLLNAASMGMTEDEAIEEKLDYFVFDLDTKTIPHYPGMTHGRLYVITDNHYHLLGAHALGEDAMIWLELLQIFAHTHEPLNKLRHNLFDREARGMVLGHLLGLVEESERDG